MQFFMTCVKTLATKEVMRRSSVGRKVTLFLEKICQMDERAVTEVALDHFGRNGHCIMTGRKLKLSSVAKHKYGPLSFSSAVPERLSKHGINLCHKIPMPS